MDKNRQSAENRTIDMIEDFARVRDVLDYICCAIENGADMPNFIPVCNDTMLSDQLAQIVEHIQSLRKKLL